MSNTPNPKIVPSYPITIGDQEYVLRFKLSTILTLEEETGFSFMNAEFFRPLTLRKTLLLISAGLREEHPEMTVDALAEVLDMEDLPRLSEFALNAFMRAFPQVRAQVEEAFKAIQAAMQQTPATESVQ